MSMRRQAGANKYILLSSSNSMDYSDRAFSMTWSETSHVTRKLAIFSCEAVASL